MTRKSKIVISLVVLVVAIFVALAIAANLQRKSARLPLWRLNLQQIEIAKTQWEQDRVNTTNDTPTFDDLRFYFSDWETNIIFVTNGEVVDPNGGVYTIGRIGEPPSCLFKGQRIHL